MSAWDDVTAEDLLTAAKVAKASGGVLMAGAAAAWELRAEIMREDDEDLLRLWDIY